MACQVTEKAGVWLEPEAINLPGKIRGVPMWQLQQTYLVLSPEIPEKVVLKPSRVKQVRLVQKALGGDGGALVQTDAQMPEDRCQQAPHCLRLLARSRERLHLQPHQLLSKDGSEDRSHYLVVRVEIA